MDVLGRRYSGPQPNNKYEQEADTIIPNPDRF